jgi:DNA-binding transcriptional regulator YdaS (Cro superfamily)
MRLAEYVDSSRGRQTEIAKAVCAQPQLVWQWARGVKQVPIARCMAIEMATNGEVRRWDLRPDDWHLIWPELVGSAGSPGVPVGRVAGSTFVVRPKEAPSAEAPVHAAAREFTRDVVQREVDRWTHGAARPSNHRERKG